MDLVNSSDSVNNTVVFLSSVIEKLYSRKNEQKKIMYQIYSEFMFPMNIHQQVNSYSKLYIKAIYTFQRNGFDVSIQFLSLTLNLERRWMFFSFFVVRVHWLEADKKELMSLIFVIPFAEFPMKSQHFGIRQVSRSSEINQI